MKRKLIYMVAGLSAMTLLSGCVLAPSINLGGGKKESASTSNTSNSNTTTNNDPHPNMAQQIVEPTIGQQLLDLKKARDAGAISEQEYEAEKEKILSARQ